MIMIDNQWEIVKSINDISKIIEEKLGSELANKIIEIFDENERIYKLESEIEDLELKNNILEDKNTYLDNQNYDLIECICKLKEFMRDINPNEIESHISNGTLIEWCDKYKDIINMDLSDY